VSGQQLSSNTITFNDGIPRSIPIPFTSNGGIAFVGFTDAGAAISSVSINTLGDIIGLDDVRFGLARPPAVPEPATIALVATALGAFGPKYQSHAMTNRRPIAENRKAGFAVTRFC
jgi:hypothetical protein